MKVEFQEVTDAMVERAYAARGSVQNFSPNDMRRMLEAALTMPVIEVGDLVRLGDRDGIVVGVRPDDGMTVPYTIYEPNTHGGYIDNYRRNQFKLVRKATYTDV